MGKKRQKSDKKAINPSRMKTEARTGKTGNILHISQPDPISSRIILLGILMVIAAAIILAANWPALSARSLSLDDDQYLVKNHLVQNPGWPSAGRFLTEVLNTTT